MGLRPQECETARCVVKSLGPGVGGLVREEAPSRQGPARYRLAAKLPFTLKANGGHHGLFSQD